MEVETPERGAFAELSTGGRLRHQPGLDGLRGLAVLAVLCFHTGRGWLPGGYLGVSLFFTVSGTVIGAVLLLEADRTGGVSVRDFLRRRARRLYPAAWLVLLAVALLRAATTLLPSTSGADIATSFLQLFNWHLIAQGQSYADLFAGPTAVLHFWSLAIEEQLYLVIGFGAAVIAWRSRRPAHLLAVAAAACALVSFSLPLLFGFGVDRTYYGTDTRAGEVLVGLVLAAVVVDRGRRRWLLRRARAFAVAGAVAAVGTLVLWRLVPAGHDSLRSGLLPLTTAASALLILAALVPAGPVWRVVGLRPLRWVGGISYGLYLIHFPVFVIVERLAPDAGLDAVAAMFAITFGLAVASRRYVEQPVRAGAVPVRALLAASTVVVLIGAVAISAPLQTTDATSFIEDLADETVPADAGVSTPAGSPLPAQATDPAGTTVVGWYGDSIAMSLLFATTTHPAPGPVRFVDILTSVGCGAALSPSTEEERCASTLETAAAKVPDSGATAGIVMSCQWELLPAVIPGAGDDPHELGDAVYDDYVRTRYHAVADRLVAAGLDQVLWVRCPHQSLEVEPDDLAPEFRAAREPGRVDHLNRIIDEVAAERPDTTTVDLATWMKPRVDDALIRPDGSHYEYRTDTGISGAMVDLAAASLTRDGS